MRSSCLVALAAAIAPLAVSAKGQLGFALGVRHSDASCKNEADFAADLAALKGAGTIVRTYAANDGAVQPVCSVPGALLPAAKAAGVKVILGLWADDAGAYQSDKELVLSTLAAHPEWKDTVYAFTVGSEALYRYQQDPSTGMTVDELYNDIADFKKAASAAGLSQPVGTADSWNKFQDGTANKIIPICDILLVNAFGYWQSQDISNASATYLDDLSQAFAQIQSVSGSVDKPELWNGETGWPTTGGTNYHDPTKPGTAVAGDDNANRFFTQGVCAALDWNINVFYFEAFAEPWKPDSTGLDGTKQDEKHWGAYDAGRNAIIKNFGCSYP